MAIPIIKVSINEVGTGFNNRARNFATVLAEIHLRKLAEATEEKMKEVIADSTIRPGATHNLENAIKSEQIDALTYGVGKVADLNVKAPYWRHCLVEDTEVYIFIENKLIPILLKDLFVLWQPNKNIKILTPNGLKSLINIREIYKDNYFMFNFSNFYSIKMSDNHKLIYKLNRNFIEKTANSFGKSSCFYSGLVSKLDTLDESLLIKTLTIDNKTLKLDYLYGWIIGFTLADGCVSSLNRISWTQKDYKLIESFLLSFGKLFDYNLCIYNEKYRRIYYANHSLIYQFITYFCSGKKDNKKINNFYLNTPKEFRQGILNGYNLGDGRKKDKNKYHIRTVSLEMRNQLLLIGASLGYDISVLRNQKPSRTGFQSKLILYCGYIYEVSRRWNVKQRECCEIRPDKNTRIKTKDGKFQREQYKAVHFNYFPKRILNIQQITQPIRLIDLAVEDELFLINCGLVSHNCNYGSLAIGAKYQHQLPKGTFQPGVAEPVANLQDGRWITQKYSTVGGNLYQPFVNKPIPAKNYIEKTLAWALTNLASIFRR